MLNGLIKKKYENTKIKIHGSKESKNIGDYDEFTNDSDENNFIYDKDYNNYEINNINL